MRNPEQEKIKNEVGFLVKDICNLIKNKTDLGIILLLAKDIFNLKTQEGFSIELIIPMLFKELKKEFKKETLISVMRVSLMFYQELMDDHRRKSGQGMFDYKVNDKERQRRNRKEALYLKKIVDDFSIR